MINARILRGTWQARRSEISSLCERIDHAAERDLAALQRKLFGLIDEVEHLRMLLREVEGSPYLQP